MSPKAKKNILDNLSKELRGFEEVFDLIDEGQKHGQREKDRINDRSSDPYALYDFLDRENNRLERLDMMTREKIDHYVASPLVHELIERQRKDRDSSKQEIIKILKGPKSPLSKNISLLFDKTFKGR